MRASQRRTNARDSVCSLPRLRGRGGGCYRNFIMLHTPPKTIPVHPASGEGADVATAIETERADRLIIGIASPESGALLLAAVALGVISWVRSFPSRASAGCRGACLVDIEDAARWPRAAASAKHRRAEAPRERRAWRARAHASHTPARCADAQPPRCGGLKAFAGRNSRGKWRRARGPARVWDVLTSRCRRAMGCAWTPAGIAGGATPAGITLRVRFRLVTVFVAASEPNEPPTAPSSARRRVRAEGSIAGVSASDVQRMSAAETSSPLISAQAVK